MSKRSVRNPSSFRLLSLSSLLAVSYGLLAVSPALAGQGDSAQLDLCQRKIYGMFDGLSLTPAREVGTSRTDLFYMSARHTCGIEILEDQGIVRIEEFERANSSEAKQIKFEYADARGNWILGVKKFETIRLHEADPAYADGRFKGHVTCDTSTEDGQDVVTYRTETPVFADGVKSPKAVTVLKLKRLERGLVMSLTAGVSGALYPFHSFTTCPIGQ
jgi:hypothetical protein